MNEIAGRQHEKELLSIIEQSGMAELIAVYGRRRVGKTYLIRQIFQKQMAFELSGVHNATLSYQLENFRGALAKAGKTRQRKAPENWQIAFEQLRRHLAPLIKRRRRVIFIDEFPWLSAPRSGFIQAFEHFWNTWASQQKNLIVVICGSAAAWMIQKVINNRGGLHNRVTRRLRLLPFTLGETEDFLRKRKINLDRHQILQAYMAMGGIPHYLKEIRPGESAMQAIDRVCFTKDGVLHNEFNNLFLSLFDHASYHMDIVRALAKKGSGLTRTEILHACKKTSGGGLTKILDELSESGFITPYIPFDRKAKDSVYQLTDEYSRFYIKFIERNSFTESGTWGRLSAGASWKSWSGNTFERICMKHVAQIKKALGIAAVHTNTSVWRQRGNNENGGAQIDLLIDRQDQCITICEMKFSMSPFEISKGYRQELEQKTALFRAATNTRKTLFVAMVTTYGVKNMQHFAGIAHNDIPMQALFMM